jgi:hypothetical protein
VSGRIQLDDGLSQLHTQRLSAGKHNPIVPNLSHAHYDHVSSFTSGSTDSDRDVDFEMEDLRLMSMSSESISGKEVGPPGNRLSLGKQQQQRNICASQSSDSIGIVYAKSPDMKARPLPPLPLSRGSTTASTMMSSSPPAHSFLMTHASSSASTLGSFHSQSSSPTPSSMVSGIADEVFDIPDEDQEQGMIRPVISEDGKNSYFPLVGMDNNKRTNDDDEEEDVEDEPSLSLQSVSSDTASTSVSENTTPRPLSTRSTGSANGTSGSVTGGITRPSSGRINISSRFIAKPFGGRSGSPTDRDVITNPSEALRRKIKKNAGNEKLDLSTAPLTSRR